MICSSLRIAKREGEKQEENNLESEESLMIEMYNVQALHTSIPNKLHQVFSTSILFRIQTTFVLCKEQLDAQG